MPYEILYLIPDPDANTDKRAFVIPSAIPSYSNNDDDLGRDQKIKEKFICFTN